MKKKTSLIFRQMVKHNVRRYLAGLRCDGGERGSTEDLCVCSDATPSTEVVTTESRQEPPEAMAGPASLASQDTEADIDLDFESFAKDDAQSGMSELCCSSRSNTCEASLSL